MAWTSSVAVVEISPETTTRPVLTSVSHATRPYGSSCSTASSTPSEIWSATLSGCPSVTDSEVNRYSLRLAVMVTLAFVIQYATSETGVLDIVGGETARRRRESQRSENNWLPPGT